MECDPWHLMEFTGDPELQLYYRSLVYSCHEKSIKTDQRRCSVCNALLSTHEQARLKPLPRMRRPMQKLVAKKNNKIPLSRIECFKLKKFMDCSQQMVVKCSQCTFVNKKPVIGRRELIRFKSQLLSEVQAEAEQRAKEAREKKVDLTVAEEMDTGNQNGEETGNVKLENKGNVKATEGELVTDEKKKKKKRKKKKRDKDFISNLLQQKESERKKLKKKKKKSTSTSVSLQQFVLSETQDTPSFSHTEILRKAIQSSDTSSHQSPVSSESKMVTHTQSSSKSSPTKSKKRSKSEKEFRKSLFFETPSYDPRKRKTISRNETPASSKSPMNVQQGSVTSSKKKKKAVQKEIRKYLTEVPHVQEKSSSLKDFLISL